MLKSIKHFNNYGYIFVKDLTLATQNFWSVKRETNKECIQLHKRSS